MHRLKILSIGLVGLASLLLSSGLPVSAQAEVRLTLTHGGLTREAILYRPTAHHTPLPTLLVLHGSGGDGRRMQQLTNFNHLADAEGFMVVYPDGVAREWNDGRIFRPSTVDDVGFISALIDRLVAEYGADPERIFASGISNGGLMSYRLACDLSGKIRGIAAVAANLARDLHPNCTPRLPIAVLIMNGTADPLVPYNGGEIMGGRGVVLSTEETVAFWRAHNQCTDRPEVQALPNRAPLDRTRVYLTAYQNCAAKVALYRIEGGGHTWAGGLQHLPAALVGRHSRDIDASAVIWAFFAATQPE